MLKFCACRLRSCGSIQYGSGSMFSSKKVGAKITPSDSTIRGELDRSPPLGANDDSLLGPVRDELLACSAGAGIGGAHTLGQNVLGAAQGDRALESSNLLIGGVDLSLGGDRFGSVISFHAAKHSTRYLVRKHKLSCLTAVEGGRTVLQMTQPVRKPKPAPAPKARKKRSTEQEVGADGFTLAQRLFRLMDERGVTQTQLARMCSQYYAAFVKDAPDDKVKQQHIFNIIQGQSSSWALPLIAAVFEVNEMWLQFGIGAKERVKN